jgi:WD40 repeat protein
MAIRTTCRWLCLLLAALLVSCASATPASIATPTAQPTAGPQTTPTVAPIVPAPTFMTKAPAPTVSFIPASVPTFGPTATVCVPPPAATPPWTAAQLPLPKLPAQSAVMFSYYVSNAACLAALDAQGTRAWSTIVSPIDIWHFDSRARMLWVLARGGDGRSTYLYWNRVGADGAGQQLQKAPERDVSGFVFSPDGNELLYAEQDRFDPPRSFAVSWQLVRLELATNQKRILLTGQYDFATPQPSRPFSRDMTKAPFGWSAPTGRIYLYEPSAAGNAHMVALWSVKSDGTDLQRLRADTNIEQPTLSPDGQRVAYLTMDPESPTKSIDVTFPSELNQLKVLDAASGATVVSLSEHGDGIFGRRLLWTGDSRALLVGRSRDRQGDYINPTLQAWLVVTPEDAGVKAWLNLDRAHEEFVDDLAACASGEIAYALNRDRQTTGIVLDDLKGHARTVAVVPGGWGSTRLVGCFK